MAKCNQLTPLLFKGLTLSTVQEQALKACTRVLENKTITNYVGLQILTTNLTINRLKNLTIKIIVKD